MGMDVYGKNPKQNKTREEFPVFDKFKKMEEADNFKQKWKELEDKKLSEQYFNEMEAYENSNPGYYFRNNCWWWRPLWNYCYTIADDIITEEVFNSGHNNSGAGLNDKDAKLLGNRLMEHIADGRTIEYQAEYEQYLNDMPDDDCIACKGNNRGNRKMKDCKSCNGTGKGTNFNKNYPFDVENVEEFALFCIESGGFEIC